MEGQLHDLERNKIAEIIHTTKPDICIEVGTWYGGGSTKTILNSLKNIENGFLFGIEYDKSIYSKMIENITNYLPDVQQYFKPYFGRSKNAIPKIIKENNLTKIDFVFLDGGNNPNEQIKEFKILNNFMPVGGYLLAHDINVRKGKYFKNYVRNINLFDIEIISTETGLLIAKKTQNRYSAMGKFRAEVVLLSQRLNPIELSAVFLSSKLKNILLKFIPSKLAYKLTNGRLVPDE